MVHAIFFKVISIFSPAKLELKLFFRPDYITFIFNNEKDESKVGKQWTGTDLRALKSYGLNWCKHNFGKVNQL